MARPRRLDGISYTGQETYFITTCTLDRRKVFVNTDFYEICRDELFALSDRFGFSTDAYVFMPDHVHWLAEALNDGAPLRQFVSTWKQRTGFAWSQRSGSRLWQKGYWERVLRPDDTPLAIARYIVENPVRAGLVPDVRDYRYSGSQRYEIEHIMTACQMDLRSGWHR
jgi:REP element-mobilizing transposase RayT